MDEDGAVWRATRARLARREDPKWQSLSWVALRPLIESINDRVNWLAPRLVDELRGAWLTRLTDGAYDGAYDGIVDRGDTDCFIVLGDTGEQDASQYVLVPALENELDGGGAAFVVICSDVIYPSGDVNDYTHGFYLPYENLLRARPDGAERAQRVYGLPGNHDWYDGLTGFMNTFCGVAPLDPAAYAWPSTWPEQGWRRFLRAEGFGRVLWRRPSHARPTRLDATAAKVGVDQLRQELTGPVDPLTRQPGPYFAIRVRDLLLVCIDGGIGSHGDSEIDGAQADWLLGLKAVPLPKVLLTGYPLLVNDEWKFCRIAGRTGTVNDIVADPEQNYVAAIGGDIHNFQHYRVTVGEGPGRPITYVVAGGGGAYLSATHPVPGASRQAASALDEEQPGLADEVRAANARAGGPTGAERRLGPAPVHDMPGGTPGMIPTPEESLTRFAEVVLPRTWRFLRALIAFGLGVLLGTVVAWSVDGFEPGEGRDLTTSTVTLAVLGVAVAGGFGLRIFKLLGRFAPARPRLDRVALVGLAAVTGALLPIAAARIGPGSWRAYLGSWVALGVVGIALGLAQRRSGWWRQPGPHDRRTSAAALAVVTIVGAVVVLNLLSLLENWWFVALAVAVVLLVAGVGLRARTSRRTWWRRTSLVWALGGQTVAAALLLAAVASDRAPERVGAVVVGVLLFAVIVVLALLLTCLLLAAWPGRGPARVRLGRRGIAAPGLIAALTVLGCASTVVVAQLSGGAFWRAVVVVTAFTALLVLGVFGVDAARRFHPRQYRWLSVLTALVVSVVIIEIPLDGAWLAAGLLVALTAAVLGAAIVVAGYLAFLGGHNLITDLDAHRERSERAGGSWLIGPEEAKRVIEWRQGLAQEQLGGDSPDDERLRRRAKFVTPSTDKPQGLIQEKVSEFFSSDAPPFVQHYLKLRVADGHLEITPHVVTGLGDTPSEPRGTIRIALSPAGPGAHTDAAGLPVSNA